MDTAHSYDIAFLGLIDPSATGRSRMVNTIERLTGRSTAECQEYLSRIGLTIFEGLPSDQAHLILDALDQAGIICEVRPKDDAAPSSEQLDSMFQCPTCGFVQPAGSQECPKCGVIFSKMEKDEVRQMQKDSALEEAQARAEQVRQEWDDRARQIIEGRPLREGATDIFEPALTAEEIPFLRLDAAEGNALMTSRQMLLNIEGEFVYLPYEIIKDVDYGGGLVVKKGHTRLVLSFHAPVPFRNKSTTSITLQLTAEAATNKEVIMDWAFARSYMCGSCGARDFDYRKETDGSLRARCMHCATDHVIDLKHHQIRALLSE